MTVVESAGQRREVRDRKLRGTERLLSPGFGLGSDLRILKPSPEVVRDYYPAAGRKGEVVGQEVVVRQAGGCAVGGPT